MRTRLRSSLWRVCTKPVRPAHTKQTNSLSLEPGHTQTDEGRHHRQAFCRGAHNNPVSKSLLLYFEGALRLFRLQFVPTDIFLAFGRVRILFPLKPEAKPIHGTLLGNHPFLGFG